MMGKLNTIHSIWESIEMGEMICAQNWFLFRCQRFTVTSPLPMDIEGEGQNIRLHDPANLNPGNYFIALFRGHKAKTIEYYLYKTKIGHH